jgi:hypothetical protein
MDIKEAQQRYGNAIAQTLNKYTAVVKAPVKAATVDDGISLLNKWAEPDSRKTKKE